MGIFGSGVEREEFDRFSAEALSRFNSLDLFVRARLSELEGEIKLKATDSEVQARVAADSAQEVERKIRSTESEVERILRALEECKNAADKELLDIKGHRAKLDEDVGYFAEAIAAVKNTYEGFSTQKESVDSAVSDTYATLNDLKNILAGGQALTEQVDSISVLVDKSSESYKNISGLLNHSLKKKSEIDALYEVVFGYEIKGEDGSVQSVDGLRDELEGSYAEIKSSVETIDSRLKEVFYNVTEKYNVQMDGQKKVFEDFIVDSNTRITAVDTELKGLLPGGMAAGLSAAYEKKKDDEVKSQEEYGENFKYAIVAMIVVSLIPFAVDSYLFIGKGFDIVQVIKETPSLIISILPLYFPVLWFALSANKKLNLSKRLIEEYTHKAVLGKTFSGLSNQIASLSHEGAVKEELRARLLFNMLQVSSENPGKLITDYNKSDHPFMEALESSSKLGGAIETLSKLPGFSALADKLSKKAQDFVDTQTQRVESGLAVQEAFESKSELEKSADGKA